MIPSCPQRNRRHLAVFLVGVVAMLFITTHLNHLLYNTRSEDAQKYLSDKQFSITHKMQKETANQIAHEKRHKGADVSMDKPDKEETGIDSSESVYKAAIYNDTREEATLVLTNMNTHKMQKETANQIAYEKRTKGADVSMDKPDKEETGIDSSESVYKAAIYNETREEATLVLTNMKTPKFLKDFRNPCWYEMGSSGKTLVCFPYLLMPGFEKCGSKDLRFRVVMHPLIISKAFNTLQLYLLQLYYKGEGSRCIGEIHCGTSYYSRWSFELPSEVISLSDDFQKMMKYFANLARESPKWKLAVESHVEFLNTFPEESRAILMKAQENHKIKFPVMTVEGTSRILTEHDNWKLIAENQGLSGPRYTTAHWIQRVNPNEKIIITMRDPVERAFSDYVFMSRLDKERKDVSAQDFHERVERSVRVTNECLRSGNPPIVCTMFDYGVRLGIGLYEVHLKHWLEQFPRKNIFFSRFEDYAQNMSRTLEQIFEFLELPPISKEAMAFITSVGIKNQTEKKSEVGEMLEKTRELLTKFYRPHVQELAKLLGDDRFLWNFKHSSGHDGT